LIFVIESQNVRDTGIKPVLRTFLVFPPMVKQTAGISEALI
jgi:hypothetical protein